jgi:hypothetical protein
MSRTYRELREADVRGLLQEARSAYPEAFEVYNGIHYS